MVNSKKSVDSLTSSNTTRPRKGTAATTHAHRTVPTLAPTCEASLFKPAFNPEPTDITVHVTQCSHGYTIPTARGTTPDKLCTVDWSDVSAMCASLSSIRVLFVRGISTTAVGLGSAPDFGNISTDGFIFLMLDFESSVGIGAHLRMLVS